MGLIAGKSGYGCAIGADLNATFDGPLTTDDYILFGVPYEALEGLEEFQDTITHTAGGYSYSDYSGQNKKVISIIKAEVNAQVQSGAMAELNAITEKLEEWNLIGGPSIYFFATINSVNKTFTDSSGTKNKYLKARVRRLRWKVIGPSLIEFSCELEDCE